MKRLLISIIWLVSVLMNACISRPDLENMPEIGIPAENLNVQVQVFAPKGWNTFKINEPIELEIYVTGSEEIIFPPDFGIKTFLYDTGNWVEILETVPISYSHKDVVLQPYNGNLFLAGAARAFPILPRANNPTLLRIFVFGHLYRNGEATDEKVGAYVDVILRP